jgi:Ras family
VGNKCDLGSQRQVSEDSGRALAGKWKCPFFETSAKTKQNSLECFHEAVRVIRLANRLDDHQNIDQKPKARRRFCSIL